MASHDDIARKHADIILDRIEETRPRAVHRDMLIEEISKAIAAAATPGWPPTVNVVVGAEPGQVPRPMSR
jgi:hypothetical protein